MFKLYNLIVGLIVATTVFAKNDTSVIFTFKIDEAIAKPVVRTTKEALEESILAKADYVIISMNTYGGMVDAADSIRSRILYHPIPVIIFIDNNAASAGALISIAADSIYMRPGANMGAATVVNQSGEVVPDKYQSYMRSTMRSTAEAHGYDTTFMGNDTIIKWHRDPLIAEGMVDPSIVVPGVADSTKVITFTTLEAIKNGYCEGEAENLKDVIAKLGIKEYELIEFKESTLDKFIGFLLSPAIQGLLIMLIIGGIYFELQSPGIGFPLGAAVFAAVFYFAPLYLEGLAENWEMVLFIVGVILIGLELFVIPGFGVTGIIGAGAALTGLILAMVDNVGFSIDGPESSKMVVKAVSVVMGGTVMSIVLSLFIGGKVAQKGIFSRMALDTIQDHDQGYISIDLKQKELIGKTGRAETVLRPSGKIEIEGEIYDAISVIGFIDKGSEITVISDTSAQLKVVKKQS